MDDYIIPYKTQAEIDFMMNGPVIDETLQDVVHAIELTRSKKVTHLKKPIIL